MTDVKEQKDTVVNKRKKKPKKRGAYPNTNERRAYMKDYMRRRRSLGK